MGSMVPFIAAPWILWEMIPNSHWHFYRFRKALFCIMKWPFFLHPYHIVGHISYDHQYHHRYIPISSVHSGGFLMEDPIFFHPNSRNAAEKTHALLLCLRVAQFQETLIWAMAIGCVWKKGSACRENDLFDLRISGVSYFQTTTWSVWIIFSNNHMVVSYFHSHYTTVVDHAVVFLWHIHTYPIYKSP